MMDVTAYFSIDCWNNGNAAPGNERLAGLGIGC